MPKPSAGVVVYYLPAARHVGQAANLKRCLREHAAEGRDTAGALVMYTGPHADFYESFLMGYFDTAEGGSGGGKPAHKGPAPDAYQLGRRRAGEKGALQWGRAAARA